MELKDPFAKYIEMSDACQGWLLPVERDGLLQAALDAWKPGCFFAELGAYEGRSSIMIAAVLAVKGSGVLYSVDPHEGILSYPDSYKEDMFISFHNSHVTPTLTAFMDNIQKAGVEDYIVPIVCESTEWDNITFMFDFLFIDAMHDEINVLKDWKHYEPYLKTGAIVAWHDYDTWYGVDKVVNDLLASGIITKLSQHGSLLITRYEGA